MEITFDPAKRAATLENRGLDFADAGEVFAGVTFEFVDDRADYGEVRMIAIGSLRGGWWCWSIPTATPAAISSQ